MGNQVVEYVYDAWGNHTVSGSNVELGNKNPYRYRSYFYDTETGLYYLKTRYYDPSVGRFLNMDSVAYADPLTVNGLNLYAYCGNNPVMGYDPEGTWDWGKIFGWIVVGIIAVAAVAAIAVVATGLIAAGGLFASLLLGGGVGALTGISGSIVAQGGFKNAEPWEVAKAGGIGSIIGMTSGLFSYGMGVIGSNIGESIGIAFGNAKHISSGIQFGKVFKISTLMSLGNFLGDIVGGLIGGTAANYFANKVFGKQLNNTETVEQGINGELPMWIIRFFSWL